MGAIFMGKHKRKTYFKQIKPRYKKPMRSKTTYPQRVLRSLWLQPQICHPGINRRKFTKNPVRQEVNQSIIMIRSSKF